MEINEIRMTFHDAEVTFLCSLNSQGTLRELPGSSKSQKSMICARVLGFLARLMIS